MGTASHEDDPKDANAFPALPVLLRFPLLIGKKCNASDMLDGKDVQASSKTWKKAKVAIQISLPSDRPPLPPISIFEATQGQRTKDQHTHKPWGEGEQIGLNSFEQRPKESSNGEPLGAGLHSLYTRIHVGCARLSVGLCTVHTYAMTS